MKKKYEAPTSVVVEILHMENMMIPLSDDTINSTDDIRSERRGWDSSIWSEMNEDEEE